MKVRIVNNGQPGYLTRVTNADTGELLDLNITEVSIKVFDKLPHAILTSVIPAVDVIVDAEIKQVCPYCGRPEGDVPPL